jgi:integrase
MPAAARKVALTDKSLQALKSAPQGKRVIVWDAIMPNMAVRVGTKGRLAFYAVRRRKGDPQPTWTKLGEYPIMKLGEAREAARAAVAALMAGDDPAEIAEARRRAEAEAKRAETASTFRAVAERFSEWYRTTPGKGGSLRRTWKAVANVIERDLATGAGWGERPIGSIVRRDIIAAIDAIRAARGPNAARHAFSAARLIFRWSRHRGIIGDNPCAGVEASDLHGAPAARDRVLTNDELRIVWGTAEAAGYPYGPLLHLLALTGARLREVAEARWSEVDEAAATLTIPTSRAKMKIPHVIPLTPAARRILAELPRFAGGDYVFTTTGGRRPISGFSKLRVRFDRLIAKAGHEIAPRWTPHDLRRTCRTALSSLGVRPDVAELVIGHQQTGLAKIYDQHRYDAEKRDALEKWERRLLAIVDPKPAAPGKVVALPARASA